MVPFAEGHPLTRTKVVLTEDAVDQDQQDQDQVVPTKGWSFSIRAAGSTGAAAIEGLAWSGEVMPRRCAVCTTALGPTSMLSFTATVLRESARASRKVIRPR